jgi:hypothetical protein
LTAGLITIHKAAAFFLRKDFSTKGNIFNIDESISYYFPPLRFEKKKKKESKFKNQGCHFPGGQNKDNKIIALNLHVKLLRKKRLAKYSLISPTTNNPNERG